MSDLMRLPGCQGIHPEIARRGGTVVVVEQTLAVFCESSMAAGRLVHSFRNRQRSGFAGREIVQVNVFISVHVRAEGNMLAVGREFATMDLPFVAREPRDLLSRDF